MKCNAVNNNTQTKRNSKLNAAKRGAIITTGMLGASTGISWVTRPDEMKKVVSDCGGKNGYIRNFVLGLAVFAGAGAILNTVMDSVARKLTSKKPPKAVN